MNNKERRILLILVVACFMGFGLFACYSRWVMKDNEPNRFSHLNYSGYSVPQSTFQSSPVVASKRANASETHYSTSVPTVAFSSTSSSASDIHVSSNAQAHSYGGGAVVSSQPHVYSHQSTSQQSAPLIAMVSTTGSAHFSTAASRLSGGTTTMSDIEVTPTIHRSSDPGDVEDPPLPVGDVPVIFFIVLVSLYIIVRVYRARKAPCSK